MIISDGLCTLRNPNGSLVWNGTPKDLTTYSGGVAGLGYCSYDSMPQTNHVEYYCQAEHTFTDVGDYVLIAGIGYVEET